MCFCITQCRYSPGQAPRLYLPCWLLAVGAEHLSRSKARDFQVQSSL